MLLATVLKRHFDGEGGPASDIYLHITYIHICICICICVCIYIYIYICVYIYIYITKQVINEHM